MSKRILAAMLGSVCAIGAAQTAFAAETGAAGTETYAPYAVTAPAPFWYNLQNITLSMSYSGGAVSWGGLIISSSGTTSVSASYVLEKKNSNGTYSYVDSWSYSANASSLSSSSSAAAPKGTYRLTVSVSATSASKGTESATDSLEKTFS